MSNYWKDRLANSQNNVSQKTTKQLEKQIKKYYADTVKRTIKEFEDTYNKILRDVQHDRKPTPADLYKLDKYWKMQAQMRKELQKMGDKQISALTKAFETNFFDVYYSIGIPGLEAYSTIDTEAVNQMINQIWVADGKSWSKRIWDNTELLAETLNEELINCVVSGEKTSVLKKKLLARFDVSYSNVDSLVRTELAHIQTQAAQKRYEDYGIEMFEVWADPDERRCDVCGKLHKKRFPASAQPPIPAHPRCRCCIVPVIEESINSLKEKEANTEILNKFGQKVEIDERLKSKEWEDSISILKKLSAEYNTRLTSIKPGAQNFAGTVNLGGEMRLNTKSKTTAIHEFAHTINMQNLAKFGVEDTNDFWKEIKAIRRRYRKDIKKDFTKVISTYADENDDEFLAEAFTHAKAKELDIKLPFEYGKDFTYSEEVLKAVNKYFKKKKKK